MSTQAERVPLGEWYESPSYLVTEETMGAFAAAVNETRSELLDGREMAPTFPVVIGWQAQNRVLDDVLPDNLLGLHGEHGFDYERAATPGASVTARSRVAEIRRRRSGSTVTAVTEIADGDGLLCRSRFTIFVVGAALAPYGDPATEQHEPAVLPPLGRVAEVIDADQPERYSVASGDTYRIHLDDDAARALGLPGRIVHGLCTLAFAARAVRDEAAARGYPRLRSLSARFSAPVLPGSTVLTELRGTATEEGLRCTFETSSHAVAVVTQGRALVAR